MKRIPAVIAFAAALGAASTAQADTWHSTDTEIGYEIHLENKGGKSADSVQQELVDAKADKQAWFYSYRSIAKPSWMLTSGKTRQQVQAERAAVTAEQRARLAEIYGSGA